MVFIAVFSSFELSAQYIIDGNNCDEFGGSNEWGVPTASDPDDIGTAGADIANYYFSSSSLFDTICIAFERYKDGGLGGGPSASYAILIDSDCDSLDNPGEEYELGADIVVGFEWTNSANNELRLFIITGGTETVIGTALTGNSECNDDSTFGTFGEFCLPVQTLIDNAVFDPCTCSDLKVTGIASYAGASFNSEPKDII